jgi:nitroimidazol reductase NimA-like FMN-containing flavoprotein (pyridoxamine 5'-phosphate oxidase superfamily)
MARGRAAIVEDAAEKCRALTLLMRTQTGKDFSITPEMAAAVTVLRIDVETYTAKARRT